MYFKFVKKYQEISAGKSVPPASKKVGRGKFPSHLPRWDRFLAGKNCSATQCETCGLFGRLLNDCPFVNCVSSFDDNGNEVPRRWDLRGPHLRYAAVTIASIKHAFGVGHHDHHRRVRNFDYYSNSGQEGLRNSRRSTSTNSMSTAMLPALVLHSFAINCIASIVGIKPKLYPTQVRLFGQRTWLIPSPGAARFCPPWRAKSRSAPCPLRPAQSRMPNWAGPPGSLLVICA